MSNSSITLSSTKLPTGTPLVVDILDFDLDRKWRGMVVVNKPALLPVALEEEKYVLIAGMPSGQNIPIMFSRTDGASAITVPLPEALEAFEKAGPPARAHQISVPFRLDDTWVRLWSRDTTRRWRVQRWTVSLDRSEDGSVHGGFAPGGLRAGQHYLQLGNGSSQPRMIAIPAGPTSFVLRPSAGPSGDETDGIAIDVDIASSLPEARVVIGYLSNGDLERAQIVGKNALVHRLATDAATDPATAVLGAYCFLACRDFERLAQLLDNHLVHWRSWLPDYAVIAAWKCFRQNSGEVERGRDLLLEAAECGIPIYTRGLRLLADGLRMILDDTSLRTMAAERADKRLRRFARVADWRPAFTTFAAAHPSKPINPRGSIRWLAEARRAASDPLTCFPWTESEDADAGGGARGRDAPTSISDAFSRAFACPTGNQTRHACADAYKAFQQDIANLHEAAP